MNYIEKKKELQGVIDRQLAGYIDNDYIIPDCPFHTNIGDSLIWGGEITFLNTFSHKCLFQTSIDTFNFDRKIDENVIIIMHGGGNFGDVWRGCSTFRNRLILKYPHNRILVFPQTIHYEKETFLQEDIEVYSRHKKITICARDNESYNFLKKNFHNEILLVPDMAYYLDNELFEETKKKEKVLFLKRTDKEFCDEQKYALIPHDAEIHDWPTIETEHEVYTLLFRKQNGIISRLYNKLNRNKDWIDDFWIKKILPYNIHAGINFLNSYDTVYTTRMHGAILSMMLGKTVFLFNNSYGKNANYYDTWLQDVNNVTLL